MRKRYACCVQDAAYASTSIGVVAKGRLVVKAQYNVP